MMSFLAFYLQATGISPLEARQDPVIYTAIFVAVVVVCVVFVANFVWQKVRGGIDSRKQSLLNIANTFQLTKREIAFLSHVARNFKIQDIDFYFKNDEALDEFFKKVYARLGQVLKGEAYHDQMLILFSLRQKVEVYRRKISHLTTSKNISRDQTLVIITPNKEQFQTRVVANEPVGFYVMAPVNSVGGTLSLTPMTSVGIFFRRSFVEYIFTTRVVQSVLHMGKPAYILNHSGQLVVLSNRTYRRVPFVNDATVELVKAEETKKTEKKRSFSVTQYKPVDGVKMRMSLGDISVGGCCLWTPQTDLQIGDLLSIQFSIGNELQSEIYGKIVRIKENVSGCSIHVCFLKMTDKSRVEIFSLAYGYRK